MFRWKGFLAVFRWLMIGEYSLPDERHEEFMEHIEKEHMKWLKLAEENAKKTRVQVIDIEKVKP